MARTLRRLTGVAPRPLRDSSRDAGGGAGDQALAEQAERSGYLFCRGLADTGLVRRLRADILALIAARGWLLDGVPVMRGAVRPGAILDASAEELTALQVEIQLLPTFRALRADPAIARVLTAVLGAAPCPGFGDVCRLVTPDMLHRTTPPHQDHYFTRGSTAQWTVWIPVGACPAALGGLMVWPGSHRDGLRAHDEVIEDGRGIAVDAEVRWHGTSYRAGDVLMFNALTVHAARPNITADRLRISVDYRYVGAGTTRDA